MAARDKHFYRTVDGHGLPHDPFNAIVGPRPIGWISTRGVDGVANLAPYSFFNAFSYTPPLIGFSSIGWKDTVANVEATGEFVWNLATRPLAEAMNATSASVASSVDEFACSGVTAEPSRLVVGQVVAVHIDRTLLVDGIYDTAAAQPILRAGGPAAYVGVTPEAMFSMTRPDDRPKPEERHADHHHP